MRAVFYRRCVGGRRPWLLGAVGALATALLAWPAPLLAGMPTPTFSKYAIPRLQDISFFLVVILLSAAVVRMLWNGLSKDFTRLPRISYLRALGATLLWGLMFILVLTMISGARELMTPGAWKVEGRSYRLNPIPGPESTPPRSEPEAPIQAPSE